MSLKLGISALFLQPGKVGGAEFMVKNLIDGVNVARKQPDQLLIFSNVRWPVAGLQDGLSWIGGTGRFNRFVQEWRALSSADKLDALLLTNYFTPPFTQKGGSRYVTVIHDLQYAHFPHHFSWRKRRWLHLAHTLTLRLADDVVVISQFVKEDLLRQHGRRWEAKVHVLPNPISFDRFGTPDRQDPHRFRRLPDRFVLSVAAHYPHKNLETLIRAFATLRRSRRFDDVVLVLVGQISRELIGMVPSRDLEDLIRELGLADQVMLTGHVSDEDLGFLYRHASLFALPSLFEGFGMPAVEALGFGLPVITTACGALPETTLQAAHYVEQPKDTAEWAAVIGEALSSPQNFRPSEAVIHEVRERYSPKQIGLRYYRLLQHN